MEIGDDVLLELELDEGGDGMYYVCCSPTVKSEHVK